MYLDSKNGKIFNNLGVISVVEREKRKHIKFLLKHIKKNLSYSLDQPHETRRFGISPFPLLLLMMISIVYTRINYPVENLPNPPANFL